MPGDNSNFIASYTESVRLACRIRPRHESSIQHQRLPCHERRPIRAHPQHRVRDFLGPSKARFPCRFTAKYETNPVNRRAVLTDVGHLPH